MPPAIIGGAIAGIGALGAAKIASSSSNKAVAAQTAEADQQSQVQQQIYGQNAAALAPYQQAGLPATQQINAMLGLMPSQPAPAPAPQPNAMAQFGGYSPQQIADYTGKDGRFRLGAFQAAGGVPEFQQMPTAQPVQAQPMQPIDPGAGFAKYLANSDYGFQMQQGGNALNSGYAGAGTLQSGAAMKGLEKFRQNLQQGFRGEYMGALGNQQSMGLSAASAQAGVGQSFANSLGSIYQNKADAISNGALVSGQNANALIGGLANIGAGFFGQRPALASPATPYAGGAEINNIAAMTRRF